MEDARQQERELVQLSPGVFLRKKQQPRWPDEAGLLPRHNKQDFPRALKIERVERLVGRRIHVPDA
jgi:hypothetical protein